MPRARIIVGHQDKCRKEELEKVDAEVHATHEADILVATTIIENGLDIPPVQWYDRDQSCRDRFGLSELYQLRGRVGRDQKTAEPMRTLG